MKIDELIKVIPTFTEYQTNKLCEEASIFLKLNEELADCTPSVCPKCLQKEPGFIKKGHSGLKQRYQCKCCGKKFTYDATQLTAHSRQSKENWNIALKDTFSLVPLDTTAKKLGVSHVTAFNMRHKILRFLEKLTENDEKLGELVEADETFILESGKGKKLSTRKPRRHGSKASKRGISHELYCICFATDRNHKAVARCVNRAKPSSADIENAIGRHIGDNSVFQCDGAAGYNQLIESKNCKKIELISHESYDKVHHLNTVNALHSRFKDMINKYHGIASKYLNRYAALFCTINEYSTCSIDELTDSIRQKMMNTPVDATLRHVFSQDALLNI